MNEMSPALQILIGIGVFILLALLSGAAVYLALVAKRLNTTFSNIDKALVPFGQSGVGQLANQAVNQGRTYFDQATDPAIVQIATFLGSVAVLAKAANAAGIKLTPDRLALWGRALFGALDNLTDGEPETLEQTITDFNAAVSRAANHEEEDFFPPQEMNQPGGAVR